MVNRKQRRGLGSFGYIKISRLEGAIIASFFPEVKDMTIKEIIKRLGDCSYERTNNALKNLVKENIVKEKKIGKTLVYSLNMNNLQVERIGFQSYLLEREIDFIKKHPTIYKLINELEKIPQILIIIIFGSYSKGTETKNSDVDLLCVSPFNTKKMEKVISSLRHKYGIKTSSVVISLLEFPKIKKENPELWKDMKEYGIVFKGEEFFYSWMYKDEKS